MIIFINYSKENRGTTMAKKNEKLAYIDPKEEPISASSINRFDIYSLKGALDDEIINVRPFFLC